MSTRAKRWLLLIFVLIVLSLHVYFAYYYYPYGITRKTLIPEMIVETPTIMTEAVCGNFWMYCDRKSVNISARCLCYADFYPLSGTKNTTSAAELFDPDSVKCALTYGSAGRLGSKMNVYATLLSLARLNHRPAVLAPRTARLLIPGFHFSLPVLTLECYHGIKWTNIKLQKTMQPSDLNLASAFLVLNGSPRANHFFMGFEEEIRKEFRFKDEIRDGAQKVLRDIVANRTTSSHRTTSSVTFIGVHVRRGDRIQNMKRHHSVIADRTYFSQATDYFRSKYRDAVFVVVSNDMPWCKENINNAKNDVLYMGSGNETDPYSDLALLSSCNHSIITIGNYGFFAAFLAGGDVVYFANFTKPGFPIHKTGDFRYPAHWHSFAATDFSSLGDDNPN